MAATLVSLKLEPEQRHNALLLRAVALLQDHSVMPMDVLFLHFYASALSSCHRFLALSDIATCEKMFTVVQILIDLFSFNSAFTQGRV